MCAIIGVIMRYIKVLLQYFKGVSLWLIGNQSLRSAFFKVSIDKLIYGNKKFKDWVSNKEVVEILNYTQDQLDKIERLKSNSDTQKAVEVINESKQGPLKDFLAKVHKNKHGGSNHGIDLGFRTKIGGQQVQFGIGFDGNSRLKNGPLSFDF